MPHRLLVRLQPFRTVGRTPQTERSTAPPPLAGKRQHGLFLRQHFPRGHQPPAVHRGRQDAAPGRAQGLRELLRLTAPRP